ncbi:MAG TPA: DNA repair protein RecN [Solirubrobacteraceae bacterium]|nr:DNA repair protein RecN [Solirubrobacteraceae bacterium]
MLHELRVENLLLLERAEMRLAPGLNVVTGETGAGKTLLAHALDLLLGGKARHGVVRGGAAEAYVEGVFALPDELRSSEIIPADAEEIVLARRVWPDGRTRAYVCGRSATVGDLRDLGSRLVAFYGQHEHRKLMLGAAQLDVLDAHCGPEQLVRRAGVAATYDKVRRLQARADELRELAGARERELDLLGFELREIEAAAPSEEEAAALILERERLQHLDALLQAASGAAEAIVPESDGGVGQLLARAAQGLEAVGEIDPALGQLAERVEALRYEAEEVGRELRAYALDTAGGGELDAAGARLEEVEERLAAFARLMRKHGGSIADVIEHAERCRARIEELDHAEVALEAAEADLGERRSQLEGLAAELSRHRSEAAPSLAEAVRSRLAELAMPEADFAVVVEPRADGCGPRGADAVELLISTNAGMPAGPLREIASGGELSRVMLALLSVAHAGGRAADSASAPLLVFDEIDAGIGGHTARAVGEHLRDLAQGRQVLCITHLPQVAALAASHFTIAKDSTTAPATTAVTALGSDAVVQELVRMLGAAEGDRAASQHARQLLRQAA